LTQEKSHRTSVILIVPRSSASYSYFFIPNSEVRDYNNKNF
jgi:hypothetical protein